MYKRLTKAFPNLDKIIADKSLELLLFRNFNPSLEMNSAKNKTTIIYKKACVFVFNFILFAFSIPE